MATDDQERAPPRPGYLYVLTHQSDPELYKVGVTVLHPEVRMAQHNSQLGKPAGQVVQQTGQPCSLKTYVEVRDRGLAGIQEIFAKKPLNSLNWREKLTQERLPPRRKIVIRNLPARLAP